MEFPTPHPTFYSYAHKEGRDRRYVEELRDALALCRRLELLQEWDDSKLIPGQQWEDVLIERARNSRVFLFILTNRFIASDFCYTELTIARRLYQNRAAAIAPILAEDANWRIPELVDLEVVMPFGRPVNRSRRATAWTEVGTRVQAMAKALKEGTYFPAAAAALPEIPPLLSFTIARQAEIDLFAAALRAAPADRPFVCVLTGERQGQSEFIENLLSDGGTVRAALQLTAAHCHIDLDDKGWINGGLSVEDHLNGALAARLEPTPKSADRKGVAAVLAGQPGLPVIRCELSAAEWRACGNGRLREFLDYWAGWPALQNQDRLLVFLSIGAEERNPEISGGLCLPLPPVSRQEVEKWLRSPAAIGRFLTEEVRAHLGEVFGNLDRVAMEDFAKAVTPILRKYQNI